MLHSRLERIESDSFGVVTHTTPRTMGRVVVAPETGFSQEPELSPGAQVLDAGARGITRLAHLGASILPGVSIASRALEVGTLGPRMWGALGSTTPSIVAKFLSLLRRPNSTTKKSQPPTEMPCSREFEKQQKSKILGNSNKCCHSMVVKRDGLREGFVFGRAGGNDSRRPY